MKKYLSILIIYLIFASCLYSQVPPPIQESITITPNSSTVFKNIDTTASIFGYGGTYNIGSFFSTPNKTIYRTSYDFSLSSIPTNAELSPVLWTRGKASILIKII